MNSKMVTMILENKKIGEAEKIKLLKALMAEEPKTDKAEKVAAPAKKEEPSRCQVIRERAVKFKWGKNPKANRHQAMIWSKETGLHISTVQAQVARGRKEAKMSMVPGLVDAWN